jgi:hypothetical protein
MQLVGEWNLTKRIRFLGRLAPSEVQTELAKCQVLLLMSDFEGLPMALLEAMAMGVVPVARAIASGVPELVMDRRTGLLVDEQPANAAAAILKLADDPALWTKCSRGAKKLVEDHFSEDSSYSKWVALLDLLCERCSIRYPIAIPHTLELQVEALQVAHPLIAQRYPKPLTLMCRVRRGLGTAARRAKCYLPGS